MKFVSKNLNLRLVLKPSMPASPLTGREHFPGLYVLFQDGVANVTDPEVANLLLKHPGFNSDFIAVSEEEEATLATKVSTMEPEHDITEIKFGHTGQKLNPAKPFAPTPELKAYINEMAIALFKQMKEEETKLTQAKEANKVSSVEEQSVEEVEVEKVQVAPTTEATVEEVKAEVQKISTDSVKNVGRKTSK